MEDAHNYLLQLSANSIAFTSVVDDPWYSAYPHPLQITVGSNGAVEHDLCHNIKSRTRRVKIFTRHRYYPNFSFGALTIINLNIDSPIDIVRSRRNVTNYW